ncbi:hypothetical protein [Streptomyces rimosus]|uniref:hypothetical protein n=1 Tax=Streptomyces rimosus TaxID=1927 RepID=UPI00131D3866|nr:hypothetical protein [Streptomyces rimosus]
MRWVCSSPVLGADRVRPTNAMVRRLIGAPPHSDGKPTIVSLATEAGLRRNKLTRKHTDLKDLFYALAKVRIPVLEALPDSARAHVDKQRQDLARVRAQRDDLHGQAQLLGRIVQVLEIENSRLKETITALEQQVAAHASVPDLTCREPVRVSGPQMKRALERAEEIAALGMGAVDVSGLPWPVCEA